MTPGECCAGTSLRSLTLEEILNNIRSKLLYNAFGPPLELSYDYDESHEPNIAFSSQNITRWKMAWRAIQDFSMNELRGYSDLIRSRCEDLPRMEHMTEEFSVVLGFGAAAFIYGGLHALAWFAHFNSSIAQLLWRLSVCMVMGGNPVTYVLWKTVWVIDKSKSPTITLFLGFPYFTLYAMLLVAYIIARAYLVVECFIGLSHLPAGVYDVPSWATSHTSPRTASTWIQNDNSRISRRIRQTQ